MENKLFNDQSLVRAIRKSIERFSAAEDIDDKLQAIMSVASLAAVGLVSNKQMAVSTISYIESRLSRG